jgi:hypothetical protein
MRSRQNATAAGLVKSIIPTGPAFHGKLIGWPMSSVTNRPRRCAAA